MENKPLDTSGIPSTQGFVQNQIAGEDPYVNAIISKYGSMEQPLDIYGKLESEAGIPQLRTTASTLMKEVGNVEDILTQIEPDVSARTRESLVTEAQRRGLVESKRKPWIESLGKLSTNLGRVMEGLGLARQDVATKTELALKGQELQLKPLEFAYAVKVDRNARLLSGFSEDKQTALDTLIANWQRTNQISDLEFQRATQLASDERSYYQTLQKSAANAGLSVSGNESTTQLLQMIGQSSGGNWDAESWWNS